MKYVFVRDHRGAFPVDLMCRTLEVGSSGFYAWLKRPESPRSQKNLGLLVEIKAVHRRSRKTYGSPRIHVELNETGHACSRYRVARLMRQHGIVSKHKKKFRITTNSVHSFPIAENLLQRRFNVSRPGQCWVSDITYISNPSERPIYFDSATDRFVQWTESSGWQNVSQSFYDDVINNKQYIDMPNQGFYVFLNPRDIFIGINISYDF